MFRIFLGISVAASLLISVSAPGQDLPNILWLTSEDNGPELGCYGDSYATTPELDALAAKGMRYRFCSSNAPVCAPARTTIITGMYPTSFGGHHMRSMVDLPEDILLYPQYLREVGYYCTNNAKEDYNVPKPTQIWDAGGKKAHWNGRAEGQPFFAIFNFTTSHESKIRVRPHEQIHDPAKAPIPAYHPDTAESRQDWAQYYDVVSKMDAQAGQRLQELADSSLEQDTIVFYYGDHGSGMPRSKRWPYDSGLRVPLIVYIPEKWKKLAPADYTTGGESERPVAFVDLAPTVLSLAGIKPPGHMQGSAFMGPFTATARDYNFGYRGRMDERIDCVRSVSDGRYVYLRQYQPHRIYGQYIAYMFQTPTTRIWKEQFDAGKLTPQQSLFWQEKPAEEFYDLESDPDEVSNLVDSKDPEVQEKLAAMRQALADWQVETRDVAFLPEAECHARAKAAATTIHAIAQDDTTYNLVRIREVAEIATRRDPADGFRLLNLLEDSDSAVRYWAATGLLIRGEEAVKACRERLAILLEDPSVPVRIVAAEALGRYGRDEDVEPALAVLQDAADFGNHGLFNAISAANAIDYVDDRAASVQAEIEALPTDFGDTYDNRLSRYLPNLKEKILADLATE